MASQDPDDITTCDLTGLAFARYQQQIRSKPVPEAQELMELIEKQLQAQRSREQQGDYLGSMIGNRPTQQQSETQITQNDTVEGDEDDDEMCSMKSNRTGVFATPNVDLIKKTRKRQKLGELLPASFREVVS